MALVSSLSHFAYIIESFKFCKASRWIEVNTLEIFWYWQWLIPRAHSSFHFMLDVPGEAYCTVIWICLKVFIWNNCDVFGFFWSFNCTHFVYVTFLYVPGQADTILICICLRRMMAMCLLLNLKLFCFFQCYHVTLPYFKLLVMRPVWTSCFLLSFINRPELWEFILIVKLELEN